MSRIRNTGINKRLPEQPEDVFRTGGFVNRQTRDRHSRLSVLSANRKYRYLFFKSNKRYMYGSSKGRFIYLVQ
jgi:hypothetical protein